jgi:hypothetical protein
MKVCYQLGMKMDENIPSIHFWRVKMACMNPKNGV